jgi:transcription termination factor Rho
MDQVIFEEFKGTGKHGARAVTRARGEAHLPAIDIPKSGTRKEEKLYPPKIVPRLHLLRRGLAAFTLPSR